MSLLDTNSIRNRRKSLFSRHRSIPLGEDILLARHGARIHHLANDRRNHRMVAVLVDGTVDYASNTLAAAPPMTPAERLSQHVRDFRDDFAPISKDDVKVLAWATAAWAVASAVFIAFVVAVGIASGPQFLSQATALFPAY